MSPRRSMWSGHLEFGMTSMPIKMYTALDAERSEMHSYHTTCGNRISQPKVCTPCDTQVSSDELSSGVDYSHGRTILLGKKELEAIAPRANHILSITQFCPDYEVNSALFEKAYFVMADGEGGAFASLHAAMLEKGVLAIGRVVFRSRETLVALRAVWGGVICHTMHWPEMLREAEWQPLAEPVNVDQAHDIIEGLLTSFIPSEHKDEQGAALSALIDGKKNALDLLV